MTIPVGWTAQRLTQSVPGLTPPIKLPAGLDGVTAGFGQALEAAQGLVRAQEVAGSTGLTDLGMGGQLSVTRPTQAGGPTFGDTLQRAISEVSLAQESAQQQMNAFLRGEPVELHQVMAATEEAGIALEVLIEVRNKFTEAYRTVINMQS